MPKTGEAERENRPCCGVSAEQFDAEIRLRVFEASGLISRPMRILRRGEIEQVERRVGALGVEIRRRWWRRR